MMKGNSWIGGQQDKVTAVVDISSPDNSPQVLFRGEHPSPHLSPIIGTVVWVGLISAPILGWDEIGLSHPMPLGYHVLSKIGT